MSICNHRVSDVRAAFNFMAVQNDTNPKMEEAASSLDMSVKLPTVTALSSRRL
jgi:hypothetical protein